MKFKNLIQLPLIQYLEDYLAYVTGKYFFLAISVGTYGYFTK